MLGFPCVTCRTKLISVEYLHYCLKVSEKSCIIALLRFSMLYNGVIILNIFLSVAKSVLTALYQYFFVSLIFAFIIMICYLFVIKNNSSGIGIRQTLKLWGSSFKSSFDFRLLFFLVFYCAMIGFRTLLGRGLFTNPLQNVFGDWALYNISGKSVVSSYGLENIILFVPFSFLFLWYLNTRRSRKGIFRSFFVSVIAAMLFSVLIEFSQLLFCLGTFQFSDLVYNTSGGIIGSLIYLACWKIKCLIMKNKK